MHTQKRNWPAKPQPGFTQEAKQLVAGQFTIILKKEIEKMSENLKNETKTEEKKPEKENKISTDTKKSENLTEEEKDAEIERIRKRRKNEEIAASVVVLTLPFTLSYAVSKVEYGLVAFKHYIGCISLLIFLANILYFVHLVQQEAEMRFGIKKSEEKRKRLFVTVRLAIAMACIMTAVTLFMVLVVCKISMQPPVYYI